MKIIIYLVIALVLFILFVRYLEGSSIFYPTKELAMTPDNIDLKYEDVYFEAWDQVKIHGWFIRHENPRATILFFHGNAGNIGDRLALIQYFHNLQLNVFIIDYRGYGNSEGHPNEQGIYRDAQGAYDYLLTRDDVDTNKIISYGASLGGVVAIDVASKNDFAGLIVDSTFTSAADMAKIIYPFVPSGLLMIKFDSANKINKIDAPKVFIHSSEDATVPFHLGQKLFELSSEPKEFVRVKGGHNDFREGEDLKNITEAIENLLNKF